MTPRVLVSACLLGAACRYDGKCAEVEAIRREACARGWIPVCPEQLGGLCTPRTPAERQENRVCTRDGGDVTEAYRRGAEEALRLAHLYGAKYAVLKERSPSCGSGTIYDGTFSGAKIPGDGVTAQRLKAAGVDTFMTPAKKVLPNLFGGLENWFFTGPSGEQIELLHML